jgi:pilus assembly protein CpaB
MRTKSLILLSLALGCGLIASIGITEVMAKRGAADQAAGEMTGIYVAISDVPMGDIIKPEMVKLEDWPTDKVPPGAISSTADMENRRPKTKIFSGSPILENQLVGKGINEGGAAEAVVPGCVVVSVPVDTASGVSSLIRPADHVDVLVHIPANGKDVMETVTRTILQNIKVFAVNDIFDVAASDKPIAAKTISLQVTPEQAELVTLAGQMGQIKLVLRSPEDTRERTLRGMKAGELLGLRRVDGDAAAAGGSDDVKSWLQSQRAKPAPVPQAEEPPKKDTESFTMRVIYPNKVNDVVMESKANPAGTLADSPSLWNLIKTNVAEIPSANNEPAVALPPAADERLKDKAVDKVKGGGTSPNGPKAKQDDKSNQSASSSSSSRT